jgi:hypothetical protein
MHTLANGHPVNILLSMITDGQKHVRELGMRRIMRARSEKYGIREFSVPKLNFDADVYIDLIDWQTRPQYLRRLFSPPYQTMTLIDGGQR